MSPTQVDSLQIGDLVLFGRSLRKVRNVTARKGRRVAMVMFAILHRSWTNRPYTVYDHSVLHQGHIRLVKRGVRLRSTKIERLVQKAIETRSCKPPLITADKMVGLVI